jgi:competence protein ComEC
MVLAFLYLIKLSFISVVLNFLARIIWFAVHLTDKKGWGYIDQIDFNKMDILFMVSFIVFVSVLVSSRSYRVFAGALYLLIGWQLTSILEAYSEKSRACIGIYHVGKHAVIDVKNTTTVLMRSDDDEKGYDFHVKPNHTSYNYANISSTNLDFVKTDGVSLFILKNESENKLAKLLKPAYLLVNNDTFIEEGVLESITPKLLIADGSNSYKYLKHLREMCDKCGIPFYSTKENGYLQLDF